MARIGLAMLVALLPLAAPAAGWRGDGTGVVASANPPAAWDTPGQGCWSVPLPAWSNSSPVVDGQRVCLMAEPTTVLCLDRDEGRVLWQAELDITRALTGAEGEGLAARLADARAAEAELAAAAREYGRLQRDVRRAVGGGEAAERLAELGRRIGALQARVDAVGPQGTWNDLGIVGYSSPTPVLAADALYALSGHGVIGAFALDGTPRWTRYLGPPVTPMKGWREGHASSPLLVDGTLVVAYGTLLGLDPATGVERWSAPGTWDHFGTPAVATVGGRPVVVTPDGRVVRPGDGKVLADGLGAVFHVGPLAQGDTVWLIGNTGNTGRGGVADAWRLLPAGDGVRAERLWHRDLPDAPNLGAPPVLYQGLLYMPELHGKAVLVFDAATGAVTRRELGQVMTTGIYASPLVAGGRLYLTGEHGGLTTASLGPDGGLTDLRLTVTPTSRATPWAEGDRLYVRAADRLYCVAR